MFLFLRELLSDKKDGEIFTLFSGWHFFYIALAVVAVAVILYRLRNKEQQTRQRAAKFWIDLAFGLYIADFFLMPLAYGEIDIEKLPFHACTAMCTACFLSYRVKFLEKYRMSFVKLGFLSNLIYLIYPAGVMWHAVRPLTYRVIQTLLFHGIMTVYGALMLAYDRDGNGSTKWGRDLGVIIGMTVWAVLGNYMYNGTSGEYSHFFNWFFVVRDPFNALPETVAPFVMPFLNIALFFTVEMLLNFALWGIRRKKR